MVDRIRFIYNRIREHLWVKPLLICILSVGIAFIARLADQIPFLATVPEVTLGSLNILLSITSGTMLGVATFAVGSMLTAYASASNTATPRSFPLVIADDVSQNALSSFIGGFIFSIVAIVALENGYYRTAGRFLLFLISVLMFVVIIFNFIRWLDRIARLGRLGHTIEKVEEVARESLLRRKHQPTLGGKKAVGSPSGHPVFTKKVGYVQRVDVLSLQTLAEAMDLTITVAALPGTFVTTDRPLAFLDCQCLEPENDHDLEKVDDAFVIAKDRAYDEDPRFGLIVLSEIASRALSPAVYDPGTAIEILSSFVRLFTLWDREEEKNPNDPADRVFVPEVSVSDMFDDAFNAIARDGAGTIEVASRLQKVLASLASLKSEGVRDEAVKHADLAFQYAKKALLLKEELNILEEKHRKVGLAIPVNEK